MNKLSQRAITNNGEELNISALLQAKHLPDHKNENSDGSMNAQAALFRTVQPYSEAKDAANAAINAELGVGVTPMSLSPSPYEGGYQEGDDAYSKKRYGKKSDQNDKKP